MWCLIEGALGCVTLYGIVIASEARQSSVVPSGSGLPRRLRLLAMTKEFNLGHKLINTRLRIVSPARPNAHG
jgi:hypothetical protein